MEFLKLLDANLTIDAPFVNRLDEAIQAYIITSLNDVKLNKDFSTDILNQFHNIPTFLELSCGKEAFIYKTSNNKFTKFFLQVHIEEFLKNHWKLPNPNMIASSAAVMKHIYELQLNYVQMPMVNVEERSLLLPKINYICAQCLIKELSNSDFNNIGEMIQQSYNSKELYSSNIQIFLYLAKICFCDSQNDLYNINEIQNLRRHFESNFENIYGLCNYLLKAYAGCPDVIDKQSVIETFELYQMFFEKLPNEVLFNTNIVDEVLTKMLQDADLSKMAIRLLITLLKRDLQNSTQFTSNQEKNLAKIKILTMFNNFQTNLKKIFDLNVDLKQVRNLYVANNDAKNLKSFDDLAKTLVEFYYFFFKNHIEWIEEHIASDENTQERNMLIEMLQVGLVFMQNLTMIEEFNQFFGCCEFWQWFTNYRKENISGQSINKTLIPSGDQKPKQYSSAKKGQHAGVNMTLYSELLKVQSAIYNLDLFKRTLSTLIENLPVVIDTKFPGVWKNINLINAENYSDTNNDVKIFSKLAKIIQNIGYINWEATKIIFGQNFTKHFNLEGFNETNVNTMCWIVSHLQDNSQMCEDKFVTEIIKVQYDQEKNPQVQEDMKASLLVNIFLLAENFESFLIINKSFITVLVAKFQEVKMDRYQGMRKCLLGLFQKIAPKIKNELVLPLEYSNNPFENLPAFQPYQKDPLFNTLIAEKKNLLPVLDNENLKIFHDILLTIVSAEKSVSKQLIYVKNINVEQDSNWENLINNFRTDINEINKETSMETINFFLVQSIQTCKSIGINYRDVFDRYFLGFRDIYNAYKDYLQKDYAITKDEAYQNQLNKSKVIMNNILKLFTVFADANYGCNDFTNIYSKDLLNVMYDYRFQSYENRVINMIPFATNMVKVINIETGYHFFMDIWNWMWTSEVDIITNAGNIYLSHCKEFISFLKIAFSKWLAQVFKASKNEGVKMIINFLLFLMQPSKTDTITNGALECLLEIQTQLYTNSSVLLNYDFNSNYDQKFFYFEHCRDIITKVLDLLSDDLYILHQDILSSIFFCIRNSCKKMTGQVDANGTVPTEFLAQATKNFMSNKFSNVTFEEHSLNIDDLFIMPVNHDLMFKEKLKIYLKGVKVSNSERSSPAQKIQNLNI